MSAPTAIPHARCEDCGRPIARRIGARGPLPQRCDGCRERRYKERHPGDQKNSQVRADLREIKAETHVRQVAVDHVANCRDEACTCRAFAPRYDREYPPQLPEHVLRQQQILSILQREPKTSEQLREILGLPSSGVSGAVDMMLSRDLKAIRAFKVCDRWHAPERRMQPARARKGSR